MALTFAAWKSQFACKSPLVQQKLATAEEFLRRYFPNASEGDLLSELRCTDFSKPVAVVSVPAGTELIGYKDPRVSPLRGTYFSRPGSPLQRLGIAPEGNLRTDPTVMAKAFNRYRVHVTIPEALESIASPAKDTWSLKGEKVMAPGGAIQYVIPNPQRHMTYSTPFPR